VIGEGWGATRDAALRLAERDAVEKASGVAISARTRVENGMMKEEKLTATARGRVAGYEVLSETSERGLYRVKVRARVDTSSSLTPSPTASVYVAIAGPMGEAAAAGLRGELAKKGVSVVPEAGQADVVVNGEVAVSPIGSAADMPAARALLSLRATEREGGRVVFEGRPAASAVDPQLRSALAKACARAGEAGALSLSRALVEAE
jgi:hypothetical protein